MIIKQFVSRGEIWKDSYFQYPAGNIEEKFIVILNKIPAHHHPIIVIPATTIKKVHNYRHGCNHNRRVFYLKANEDFFEHDTLLQIYVITDISAEKFQEKIHRKVLNRTTSLNKKTIDILIKCIEELKVDIQEEYHQYIF
jgi:hypothetical protein